jgi:hypothetical protein
LVEAYEDTSEAVDGVLELNQNMKQFGLEWGIQTSLLNQLNLSR